MTKRVLGLFILVLCALTLFACEEKGGDDQGSTKVCKHVWPEYYTVVEPTESADGARVFTCVLCGETKSMPIPMLSGDSYFVIREPAECEKDGSAVYTSEEWGEYTVVLPALGHLYPTTPSACTATCTKDGENIYECERENCNEQKRETVRALGHDYVATVMEGSCVEKEKGHTEYTCSRCGDTYNANYTDYVHDYEKTGSVAGSCTEKSYDLYVCRLCHHEKKEYSDYAHVYNKDTGKCDNCGAACPHEFSEYVCDKCGFSIREELDVRSGIFSYDGITYFGSYPQSHVSDKTLVAALDDVFSDGKSEHTYNNITYVVRSVSAQSDRSVLVFSDGTSMSAAVSGREKHYFRYDPIAWKEEKGGVLVAVDIIETGVFQKTESIQTGSGSAQYYDMDRGIYANEWTVSSARAFLSETFYEMAFNEKQKAMIKKVTNDNTGTGLYPSDSVGPWGVQPATEDDVFLPAYTDLFEKDAEIDDAHPQYSKRLSDYALCSSVRLDDRSENKTKWFLRSCGQYSGQVCAVEYDGSVTFSRPIILETGIAPALKLVSDE